MTREERENRINEISEALGRAMGGDWDTAYEEYCDLTTLVAAEYSAEKEHKVWEFYHNRMYRKHCLSN